jgi:hypothetical protein
MRRASGCIGKSNQICGFLKGVPPYKIFCEAIKSFLSIGGKNDTRSSVKMMDAPEENVIEPNDPAGNR